MNDLKSTSEEESSSSFSCDDSIQSETETQKAQLKKKAMISEVINKNISSFYFNLDIEKELDEDFNTDELEDYSQDEIEPDVQDMLKSDNKKVSCEHAIKINEEMSKMS